MLRPAPPGWHHAPSATIGDVGEHALIRWIAARVAPSSSSDVYLGIGDDAAVVRPRRNHLDVLTTDVLVEGVHFTRALSSAADVGHRALHVNLSDVASMGAEPRVAMLSLGLPATLEAAWVAECVDALVTAAAAAGVQLVGGNVSQSPVLFLDVTVSGAVKPRHVMRRSGARAGDELYVSGEVGAAAAGLAWLQWLAGRQPGAGDEPPASDTQRTADALETAIARYRRPDARIALGVQVGRNKAASACMDTSDGLADALRQLAGTSGVGVRVDSWALPLSPAAAHVARATGAPIESLTWSGGEDYELLFAVPKRARRRFAHASGRKGLPPLTRIGVCTKEPALVVLHQDGREAPLPGGYEHFAVPNGRGHA
jgi:thiamine-monophosphate kinase